MSARRRMLGVAQGTRRHLRTSLALASLIVLALGVRPVAAQTEVIEYYGHDALGSIRIAFDVTGIATARADVEPFGELFTVPGMPGGYLWAPLFTGQERDPEASQDYFGARYYQPRVGRFSQVDPVYAGLFDPQQWNRYAYVRNNPLMFVDPTGETPNPSLCTAAIRATNPNDYHCVGGGTGGTSFGPIGVSTQVAGSLRIGGGGHGGGVRGKGTDLANLVDGLEDLQQAFIEFFQDDEKVEQALQDYTTLVAALAPLPAGKGVVLVGAVKTSQKAFRAGVLARTGASGVGKDAHHVYTKASAASFEKIGGLNIWNPQNGALWSWREHRSAARAYQTAWDRFFVDYAAPTIGQARAHAERLARRFGFDWP